MKNGDEKLTFDELKSFRYMFKQSPVYATLLILMNILIVVGLGVAVFL